MDANDQGVRSGCCPKLTISTGAHHGKQTYRSVLGTVTNALRGWQTLSSSARQQHRVLVNLTGFERREGNSDMRMHGEHTMSGRLTYQDSAETCRPIVHHCKNRFSLLVMDLFTIRGSRTRRKWSHVKQATHQQCQHAYSLSST